MMLREGKKEGRETMNKSVKAIVFALFCMFMIRSLATSQIPVLTKRLKIYAEKGWQDSGIKLKEGQYYSVKAKGYWVSGSEPIFTGPEGHQFGTIDNNALVGKISSSRPDRLGYDSYKREIISQIILIGRGGEFKSYTDGKLWLAMGEWSGCKECRGEVEVLIVVYE
jgi:hypothetical protein